MPIVLIQLQFLSIYSSNVLKIDPEQILLGINFLLYL